MKPLMQISASKSTVPMTVNALNWKFITSDNIIICQFYDITYELYLQWRKTTQLCLIIHSYLIRWVTYNVLKCLKDYCNNDNGFCQNNVSSWDSFIFISHSFISQDHSSSDLIKKFAYLVCQKFLGCQRRAFLS